MPLMLVGRVIQGVGGGVVPLAFGIIRDEFPQEKVAGAVGVIAALAAVGGGVGLVLAGPIVNVLDYHWLFWIPMIVLVLAAVAAKLVIPESPVRVPGRLNWVAALLMSGWLVALLVAISEAPSWGWGSARVIGLLVVAAVLAAVWIVVESRSDQPLIDMRMMRIPVVWTTNLVAVLFGVGMYATFAFLPEFLQTPTSAGYGFGLSITQSGLILLPLSVTMFAFGVASGRLTLRFGGKRVLVAGSRSAWSRSSSSSFAHDHQWEIVVAMALMGAGFGLAFSAMSNLIVEGVPRSADRCRERDERQHPHHRWVDRCRGDEQHRGGERRSRRAPDRVRLHARIRVPRGGGDRGGVGGDAGAVGVAPAQPDELHDAMPHAELGMVAAGTLVGDEPE